MTLQLGPMLVESVTCSVKIDPSIDVCQARKKRTSATFIDGDAFPHYNYQNELSDTEKCSTNRF